MEAMNVGFLSTRFHGTDGVSLEAAKWAQVLEHQGHRCFWFAGKLDRPPERSFHSDKAYFEHPEIIQLQNQLFGPSTRSPEVTAQVAELTAVLKNDLHAFVELHAIDLLIPQNILAIPMNVPLGLAVTELVEETQLPTIAHHHDFHWERDRFAVNAAEDYLDRAFPPSLSKDFVHAVINTTARDSLVERCGLRSQCVPNVLDFENAPPGGDGYGDDLREELGIAESATLVLQPTRIVERKGIEHAIELVRQLQERGREVVLVISHDAGDEGFEYLEQLNQQAAAAGIRMILAADRVAEERGTNEQGQKRYTLWDVYPHADFVTFPSLYEGFGNALLEALWFRKPLLTNRYPVYVRDIEPIGLKIVEMAGAVGTEVTSEVEALLDDPAKVTRWAEHNYDLCLQHYSYQTLRGLLEEMMGELFEK